MEQLAGRLRWERTEHGIRVEFPPIRSASAIVGTIRGYWLGTVGGWLLAFVFIVGLQAIFPTSHNETWWELPLWLASGIAIGDLTAKLPHRWTITMDRDYLWIEQRRLPWEKKEKRIPAEQLHSLRFVKSEADGGIRNAYHLDEIQFDKNLETQCLAPGITREEADALIARMKAVYPFPAHPASETRAANQASSPS
jgi:hypothetical protein